MQLRKTKQGYRSGPVAIQDQLKVSFAAKEHSDTALAVSTQWHPSKPAHKDGAVVLALIEQRNQFLHLISEHYPAPANDDDLRKAEEDREFDAWWRSLSPEEAREHGLEPAIPF